MNEFVSKIVRIEEERDPYIRVDFAAELNECDSNAIKITLEKIGNSIDHVNMDVSSSGKHYAIVYRHPCATIEETLAETNQILNEYIFKTWL